MKNFEIGRLFENLLKRVEMLENNSGGDGREEETEITEDGDIVEFVPESMEKIENGVVVVIAASEVPPKIFLTGGKRTGRDERGRWGRYSGTVWLQDNVGRKLKWFYIETGSDNICNLKYPKYASGRSAHYEARNTHICTYGWRGMWRPGQGGASSWGRFVDENGNGWQARWSAGC
ncbi:MAG: hypothetical protein ABIO79_01360 [Ferruginibacter sp.]